MTKFVVGSLIRIKGTKCEGVIKMIESESIPNNSISKKDYSAIETAAFAYVTLNKGATYSTMRVFKTKDDLWNLAKVPFSELELRIAGNATSVYELLVKNDFDALQKLNKTKLLNKPPRSLGSFHNTLGYALSHCTYEIIDYLLNNGVPVTRPRDFFAFSLRNIKLSINERVDLMLKLDVVKEIQLREITLRLFPLVREIFFEQNLKAFLTAFPAYKADLFSELSSVLKLRYFYTFREENLKYLIQEGFDISSIDLHNSGIPNSEAEKNVAVYAKLIEYSKNPLLYDIVNEVNSELRK